MNHWGGKAVLWTMAQLSSAPYLKKKTNNEAAGLSYGELSLVRQLKRDLINVAAGCLGGGLFV